MNIKYTENLKELRPYLISYSGNLPRLDLNNTDLFPHYPLEILDPLSIESNQMVNKILVMDKLAFTENGMPMPKWVLFDCAMIPGAVFGFNAKGSAISQKDRELLGVCENDFFPVSMYIAIPTLKEGRWFGHNLVSLNHKLETDYKGLGTLTKALALKVFKVKTLQGATQWDSKALGLHIKLSKMEILSAWTPNHTHSNSLCYQTIDEAIEYKNEFNFTPTEESLKDLQKRIENKERFMIFSKKNDTFCLREIK